MPASASRQNQAMCPLAARDDDQRRQQRPERAARVAAHLEERLREAVPSARGEPRHARRLRMEDRRAHAHGGGGEEEGEETARVRQQHQTHEGNTHAGRQREGLGAAVGVQADKGLQDGGRQLERERDEPDLREAEREMGLEQRIDRREDRLDRVVDAVREADGQQDAEHGGLPRGAGESRKWEIGSGKWGRGRHAVESLICTSRAGWKQMPLRLPPSAFRLPPSAFRLPPSAFRLPPSAFRLPPSAFRLASAGFVRHAGGLCARH